MKVINTDYPSIMVNVPSLNGHKLIFEGYQSAFDYIAKGSVLFTGRPIVVKQLDIRTDSFKKLTKKSLEQSLGRDHIKLSIDNRLIVKQLLGLK